MPVEGVHAADEKPRAKARKAQTPRAPASWRELRFNVATGTASKRETAAPARGKQFG
jgi:hypothetical protein